MTCEASSQTGTQGPGKPKTIKLNTVRNTYTVYIGVAGVGAATAGAFRLDVDVKPKK